MDFFDWDTKIDTIIGNPPYIRFQDIPISTKNKLPDVLDGRSNLFLFFIWRAIDLLNEKGELIFLVPHNFIKLTAAAPLNERLYTQGGFTYWKEYGDQKIFENASPNVAIFRWVKGQKHTIPVSYSNGFLSFSQAKGVPLSELFEIRVGGASGLNEVLIENSGNIDLVVSSTKRTGQTVKAHYKETPDDYLLAHKKDLITRRIKNFTEKNWWEWGRKIRPIPEGQDRIYVNCKTRDEWPFFTNASGWYDGSVLALIPKSKWYNSIEEAIEQLNQNNWEEQGFKVGGRLIFGQKSLSNTYLKT